MKPNAIRSSLLSPVFAWGAKLTFLTLLGCLVVYLLFYNPSLPTRFHVSIIRHDYPTIDFSQSLDKKGRAFWESFQPSYTCPAHLLQRIGLIGDGGKWTCGVTTLGKLHSDGQPQTLPSCLVYSFGVSKDSSFESEVLANTYCEVYAYDPTVDVIGKPLSSSNPRVHFQKIGIGAKDDGKYKTLKSLMENNGGHEWIDILKIDVEGAEFSSIDRILEDFPENQGLGLPFGQLLLELHIVNWGNNTQNNVNPKAEFAVNFIKRLESRGLRMFNYEVNKWAGYACCNEISMINTKSFALNRFLDVNVPNK